MTTKIYIVTMASYTQADNNLYVNTWNYGNEEEARQQYVSLRDEQIEECRWASALDNNDHTGDYEYKVTEHEEGTTYEASSEAYEGYHVQVKMECQEIDVPEEATTEDEDDNTVAVVVLQFDDDDNFKKAQRIFDSEGESKYWAADWDENTRTIYFTDGGDLQSLSADLIKELEQYGIMGYTRIIR